ncbi:unnamed protein product [Soboliphyme baturini]|uniref:EF1_GNE domain-containing protein n=1 Tax=Soboliphyme baturini TaxID=241478 RepID=A0A183IE70_9BILA|nr:unnamed protein product [Soboliphyme baturini]
MVQFNNLVSADGLTQLNNWLESRSYIEGYSPSTADAETFSQVKNATGFPHVQRWIKHISSFPEKERNSWPKAVVQSTEAKLRSVPPSAASPAAKEEEEDIDLFGSSEDEDDEAAKAEKEKIRLERLKAYNEKKAKKPKEVAKSNIILDVKPWGDDTDLKEMEKRIRDITADGLVWGASRTIPVAYGIKKIQISCVVEDDKVGTDFLEEAITGMEDLVQSVDVVAFNKI